VITVPEARKPLLWAAAEEGAKKGRETLWWPALAPLTPAERAQVRAIIATAYDRAEALGA
jgi:hypothetical protein